MSRMLRALQTLEKGVPTEQEPELEAKPSGLAEPLAISEKEPSPAETLLVEMPIPEAPISELPSEANLDRATFDAARPDDARNTLFAMEQNWNWVTAQLATVSEPELPVAESIEPAAEISTPNSSTEEAKTTDPTPTRGSATTATRRPRRVRRARPTPSPAQNAAETSPAGGSTSEYFWKTPALESLADVERLAVALRSQVANQRKPRWIMITSASEATTYSGSLLPLAGAIGSAQENVLVIDARPPKPCGEWASGTVPLGLGDLLAGRATWPEVIEPTDRPRVYVVSTGQRSKEEKMPPARLAIFNLLAPQFDYILVRGATPADRLTRVLAARSAANYLLVGLDLDRPDRIRRAVTELSSEGIRLAGAIALAPS